MCLPATMRKAVATVLLRRLIGRGKQTSINRCPVTVSYTHLDVYKRQSFWYLLLNAVIPADALTPTHKLCVITTTMLTFGMGASTQALFARCLLYTSGIDLICPQDQVQTFYPAQLGISEGSVFSSFRLLRPCMGKNRSAEHKNLCPV